MNKLILLLGALIICVSCDKNDPQEEEPKIPDPLVYGNINQFIVKGPDWKQIVKDKTQFVLGEADSEPYQTYATALHTQYFYRQSYGTFPAIDGSTVCIPMAAEFVWQFTNLSDIKYPKNTPEWWGSETLTFLSFSTTSRAYDRIINNGTTQGWIYKELSNSQSIQFQFEKRPDIVLATYPSNEELNMASNAEIELIIKPVCYDSFVFITHKDNPVESLTVEQIQKIYSGNIANWKEVGGSNQQIVAYQREQNSGSQTAMEEWVMKGIPMTNPPTVKYITSMGMLIDAVADYENGTMSLGYTYKYYVDRLYKSPDIKILKVNGIIPSDENVRNNSYPFIAPYNAVIRSTDVDEVGGRFMDWMLSDEGQACIAQAGYVSLREL